MYLASWGFIKSLFKWSKINKLRNFVFSILRFCPRPPLQPQQDKIKSAEKLLLSAISKMKL